MLLLLLLLLLLLRGVGGGRGGHGREVKRTQQKEKNNLITRGFVWENHIKNKIIIFFFFLSERFFVFWESNSQTFYLFFIFYFFLSILILELFKNEKEFDFFLKKKVFIMFDYDDYCLLKDNFIKITDNLINNWVSYCNGELKKKK